MSSSKVMSGLLKAKTHEYITQKSWTAKKNIMSNKKHMSSSKIMSSQLKKHTLKTHEQQMTTWEMQQSWVSLLKPPKKWAGNKHMRNSKVMSSLEKNKSWATKTKIMRISRVMSSLYQKKTKHFWEPINNMRNSKGMSSLTKKTKKHMSRKSNLEKLKSHE